MIENLPIKAVLRAVEIERRMLEDDVAYRRSPHTMDENSILDFCHFLTAVARGSYAVPGNSSLKHVAFYGKIVDRLVDAGELPYCAKEQFYGAYSENFMEALAV